MKALILFSGGYIIFKFIINVYVYYSPILKTIAVMSLKLGSLQFMVIR